MRISEEYDPLLVELRVSIAFLLSTATSTHIWSLDHVVARYLACSSNFQTPQNERSMDEYIHMSTYMYMWMYMYMYDIARVWLR